MIRFLLDEHVHPAIASGLSGRGIDVVTAADAALLGEPDTKYITFAATEDRVVVTQDDDFLTLHAAGEKHSGIAYCRQGARTISEMITALVLMDTCLDPSDMYGKVEYL